MVSTFFPTPSLFKRILIRSESRPKRDEENQIVYARRGNLSPPHTAEMRTPKGTDLTGKRQEKGGVGISPKTLYCNRMCRQIRSSIFTGRRAVS